MTLFGIVNSYDVDEGRGSIKPETGGYPLGFTKCAFSWEAKVNPPKAGQRLSYEVGTDFDNKPCALNLQTV